MTDTEKQRYPLWHVKYQVNGFPRVHEHSVGGHESDIVRLLGEAHDDHITLVDVKQLALDQAYTTVPKAYVPAVKLKHRTREAIR